MKVKVLIEYDFPDMDSLTQNQLDTIENEVCMSVPGLFETGDDEAIISRGWSVEILGGQ
jgi:hypothetical protein